MVTENKNPITKLNELEFLNNKIFANIWLTNDIVRINSENGIIEKRFQFDFLRQKELKTNPNAQEFNGIAIDINKNEFLVTGKLWKHIYVFDLDYFTK